MRQQEKPTRPPFIRPEDDAADLEADAVTLHRPETDLNADAVTLNLPEADLEADAATLHRPEADLEADAAAFHLPEADAAAVNRSEADTKPLNWTEFDAGGPC